MIKHIFITSLLLLNCHFLFCNNSPLIVISPSYKNALVYQRNLNSLLMQDHPFHLIYIADGDLLPSSDGTGKLVEQFIKEHNVEDKVTVIRNSDRKLALNNIYRAALSCPDDAIIAIVDGDDELACPDALSQVISHYNNPKHPVWMTYGNFKYRSSNQKWFLTLPIPQDIIDRNAIREWGNGPTHLKTVKSWIFKQIKIEDLFYEGNFFKTTYDVAIFEPIMELVGKHFACIDEVLYVYNDENSLNDHKVDRDLQIALDHYIRSKPKYTPLDEDLCGRVDTLKESGDLQIDLIVFSSSAQQTENFLEKELPKLHDIRTLYIHSNDNMLQSKFIDKFEQISSADQIRDIISSTSCAYVGFIHDTATFSFTDLVISDALYWLEQTHAYAFFGSLNKKAFIENIQASDETGKIQTVLISLHDDTPVTVYAWQFEKTFHTKNNQEFIELALYRKNDLINKINFNNVHNQEIADTIHDYLGKITPEHKVGIFYQGI